MIELVDTLPDINVQPAEYKRLLGYPRDRVLGGRARELADWARDVVREEWPAVGLRAAGRAAAASRQRLDPHRRRRRSPASGLQKTLAAGARPTARSLVAVSAGPEVEAEAQRLWQEEKPDEYFFLEIFGSAVVEHLMTMTGARLCAWAEAASMAVLPHYSPGYPEWDIAEQARLLELIIDARSSQLPAPLDVLESGMLRPKKSLLAVFGLTHHIERVGG